ncbi:MAG: hypothetical protein HYX92_16805 [Chloroflexi bacterium]|nr:hypothetical protein [Chloroflexota bacterium]
MTDRAPAERAKGLGLPAGVQVLTDTCPADGSRGAGRHQLARARMETFFCTTSWRRSAIHNDFKFVGSWLAK